MRHKLLKSLILTLIIIIIPISIFHEWINLKKIKTEFSVSVQNLSITSEKSESEFLVDNRIGSCLNDVRAKNRLAFVTLAISDHQQYIESAAKLLQTVINNTQKVQYDKVILELKEKPLNDKMKETLLKSGWDFICTVNRIGPIKNTGPVKIYRELFTKLIIFNMSQYDGIVTMDADTIAIGNITELFYVYKKIDFDRYFIAAAPDIDFQTRYDTILRFNAGVFIVRPNGSEFKRLMELKTTKSHHLDPYFAEQTFLNHWYGNKWYNFGHKYNCIVWHLKYYGYNVSRIPKDVHVIHFTNLKPWKCNPEATAICDLWKRIKV